MEPITATILGGLLWFFVGSFASVLVYMLGLAITAFISDRGERAFFGVLISWVLYAVCQLIVLYQTVIHIVRLVQQLTGSEVTV